MENYITVPKYAAKHKLTIHQVIKMVMRGELQSAEKIENGKTVLYIYAGTGGEPIPPQRVDAQEETICYQLAYESLHKEYLILKTKYEKLLKTQAGL